MEDIFDPPKIEGAGDAVVGSDHASALAFVTFEPVFELPRDFACCP